MATRKRKPWNAGLVMPGLLDEPATVVKPSPDSVTVGHSTGAHLPPQGPAKATVQPFDRGDRDRRVDALLQDNATLELRLYTDVDVDKQADWADKRLQEDLEMLDYLWTDGNYGCDCNRALLFQLAKDATAPETQVPCGLDRFTVLELRINGKVLLQEAPGPVVSLPEKEQPDPPPVDR